MIRGVLRRVRNGLADASLWQARRSWDATHCEPGQTHIATARTMLERILVGNILGFWLPQSIDEINGGYRIGHDDQGRWQGASRNRQMVSQARTTWFFARMLNSAYRSDAIDAAARHGFHFLRDQLWDAGCGGFYWEVDSGNKPTLSDKHLYGQAFGLYALSEYALATGDAQATAMSRRLYAHIESAHDDVNGGYREYLRRDWSVAEPHLITYMAQRADVKQLNTHIHLLEAYTRYCDLVQEGPVRERVLELATIVSNTVVRKRHRACRDVHEPDWTPSSDEAHSLVNYGHDLEGIWLLLEACRAARLPNALLRDHYEQVFRNTWHFGFDHRHGGFYYQGPPGRFATARHKMWWVQAEGLVCALQLFVLTRRRGYFRCFEQTLRWIAEHQIDWRLGEWHRRIETNGRATGGQSSDNPGAWKTPYHNGRASLRCLELLATIQGMPATGHFP